MYLKVTPPESRQQPVFVYRAAAGCRRMLLVRNTRSSKDIPPFGSTLLTNQPNFLSAFPQLAFVTLAAVVCGGQGSQTPSANQYHIQTDEGPERYFRFQTDSGQFRKEKRLQDGTVIGKFPFYNSIQLIEKIYIFFISFQALKLGLMRQDICAKRTTLLTNRAIEFSSQRPFMWEWDVLLR